MLYESTLVSGKPSEYFHPNEPEAETTPQQIIEYNTDELKKLEKFVIKTNNSCYFSCFFL